jgi:hypothetical protein
MDTNVTKPQQERNGVFSAFDTEMFQAGQMLIFDLDSNSDTRNSALARPNSNSKLQTRSLVREGSPYQRTRNCLKIRKKFGRVSQMGA